MVGIEDEQPSTLQPFETMFRGTHVLVTGASSGIGLSVAHGFARCGARLSILAENDEIEASADEIAVQCGMRPRVIKCDVSDQGSISEHVAQLPPVNVLAHIAGIQPTTPVLSDDPSVDVTFSRCMDINVTGTWYMVREVLKSMPTGGRIILTSSNWAETGVAEYAGYVASKSAILGLTRSLAMELGGKGITVNAVCPGWVNTEGAMWTVRETAVAENKTLDTYVAEQTAKYAIPGIMQPDAMQGVFLFLASEMARDATGQAWNVDRGSGLGFR